MLVVTIGVGQQDLEFQLLLSVEHGTDDLFTDALTRARAAFDQLLPDALCRIGTKQAGCDLIDFGNAQLMQQIRKLLRMAVQARAQFFCTVQLQQSQLLGQVGQIQDAQRDAGAFENILVAAAALMQLQLSASQAAKGQQRHDGEHGPQPRYASDRNRPPAG